MVKPKRTVLPPCLSMLRIIKKLDTIENSIIEIECSIYWIIDEIACHSDQTDQIDFLLDCKIMPAVINRFGQRDLYNSYEQIAAAEAIEKCISYGSFSQNVQLLSGDPEAGDDCIKYIFEYLMAEHYDRWGPSPIHTILDILKDLLRKHEKNQQLIKSTMSEHKELTADDMKKHGLVRYDLFEKIESHDGITKIKNLQDLKQKKITEATIVLLDLYSKMKEKAESEKKIEVVDQKMKKVSVKSNQSGNEVLPRRMFRRSSKKGPLKLSYLIYLKMNQNYPRP